jgi:phenylalanyl-tRNA synthetase beta chain
MTDELPPQRRNLVLEGEDLVRDALVGCGLDEVITYALTSKQTIEALDPAQTAMDPRQYLRLTNPLTSEREYMRRTLVGSLLETMRDNFRFLERIAIFEVGRVYHPRPDSEIPDEPRRLGIALGGPRDERVFLGDTALLDFYDLKGAIDEVLARLAIAAATFVPSCAAGFHPGRTAELLIDGQPAGVLGEIHPLIRERFDLPQLPILVAELDLRVLLGAASEDRIMKPISRFPAVSQDIAVVLDEGISAASVRTAILAAGGDLLADAVLFDLYRGEQLGVGKKSLAYALTFRAMDRTLTDAEVSAIQDRIVQALRAQFGAILRG